MALSLYLVSVCVCACVFPHNTLWHCRGVCVCLCVCVYSSSLSDMISRPRRALVSTSTPRARSKQPAASKHRRYHQGISGFVRVIRSPRHRATRRGESGGDGRSQNGIYARLVSLEGLDHAQLFVQSLDVGESAYPVVWRTLEYAPPRVVIDL